MSLPIDDDFLDVLDVLDVVSASEDNIQVECNQHDREFIRECSSIQCDSRARKRGRVSMFEDPIFYQQLVNEENEHEKRIETEILAMCERQNERNMVEARCTTMNLPSVSLISTCGIRVIKFPNSIAPNDDFRGFISEYDDYMKLKEMLGNVRFLIYLYYADKLNLLSYEKLFITFEGSKCRSMIKIIKSGGLTLLDDTSNDKYWSNIWRFDLKAWIEKNQFHTDSVEHALNSGHLNVPTDVFKNAIVNTFIVNFRDMRGPSFDSLCRTEAFWYALISTSIDNNTKPIGLSMQPDQNDLDKVVVKPTPRPEIERLTSEDPYLQMYWYYEDLRDKYIASKDKQDTNKFEGTEKFYASCYYRIDVKFKKRNDQCKLCGLRLGPAKKINHGPHLRDKHPLVFAVVSVNMYKVDIAGEEIDYPKQVKKEILDTYEHILF